MKVSIDPQRCQGHTVCALTAPELFTIRDDDAIASVIAEQVPASLEAQARFGANSCPERAIIISE
jgi:ferredoxin